MKVLRPTIKDIVVTEDSFFNNRWNNFFSDFGDFQTPVFKQSMNKSEFIPTCNITESPSNYLLIFEIPGVSKEKLNIEVQNSQLKISGEKSHEFKENDENKFIKVESCYGKFQRVFNLPEGLKPQDISADFKDGVLKICVPKKAKEEVETHRVQIKDRNETTSLESLQEN